MADSKIKDLTAKTPAVDTDEIIINDAAGGNLDKKLDLSVVKTYVKNGLAASDVTDFDTEVSNNASVAANTAKTTNQTHTGDVTGSVALTIAAKAVDVAMLADGTDGELITWGATGVAETVAVGTATHVLTSNGVGLAPTFQAATGGFDTAGTGLTSSGSTVNAIGTASRISVSADAIDIDAAYVGQASLTTLGTITTGVWTGTDIAVADGGTGASTAQAAIDTLSAVSAATNEHVLTKDTGTGNAIWKVSSSGFSDPMTTRGDIIYKDSGGTTTRLGAGTVGQVLTSDGTDIAWGAAGAGDMILASAQANTGIKTFDDTTMKLRNVAGTFDGYFVNTNTADRVYTLLDATGTIPLLEAANTFTANQTISKAGILQVTMESSTASRLDLDTYDNLFNSRLRLRTSRGSIGSPATVIDADTIFQLNADAHDGTDFVHSANISVDVNGTVSTGVVDSDMVFSVSNGGVVAEGFRLVKDKTLLLAGKFDANSQAVENFGFDANGTGNSLSNVDVADLANGTDGQLITWDAAGAPATVAVGTATHVLTSNGTGAAPTFQAAASGGHVIEDEGTPLTSRANLNFIGAIVTAADNTPDTDVTVGGTAANFNTACSDDTFAFISDNLSVFAATTSLQLKNLISDETGSGALVFATSPTLVTPALGTPASGVATNLTGTASGLTAGNVTTNANLTGDVTSVGNAATIPANTVTLAMMAGGTDGNLITYDTAGDPAFVTTGTSGQVLTSNGAGTAPTFQAAAGGGGGSGTDETIVKTSDESRDSGGTADTPTIDSELVTASLATGVYAFEARLVTITGSGVGMDYDFNGGTATFTGVHGSGTAWSNDTGVDADNVTTEIILANSANQRIYMISGTINVTGAGTFGVRWSQTVSSATATIMKAGSRLTVMTTGTGGGSVSPIGVHDIWIPASAMWGTTTAGCADITKTELATNDINIQTLDFDTTTAENAQFTWTPPRNYDNGTITVTPRWTAASGSGTVKWDIKAVAISNDDPLDAAFGTLQGSTDTLLLADDLHIGPATSPITINGTPQDSDLIQFNIARDTATDTLGVDAKLIGVVLHFTIDAAVAA